MHDNKKFLIAHLQSKNINGRFEKLSPINCDPLTGAKIGNAGALSIVFKGRDNTTGDPVAVKFFDPDLMGLPGLKYRLDLFERESELLASLSGTKRTATVLQPLTDISLQLTVGFGKKLNMHFQYIVTEWLDGDVETFFLNHTSYDDAEKLAVFRECCLAVFALHRQGIAHRDIKADNLRFTERNGQNVGVAIDLGTAAAHNSPTVGTAIDYSRPVGARAYAPIEASLGLGGIRKLGFAADYHALGCLLFELFHADYYYLHLLNNVGFISCRTACEKHMLRVRHGGISEAELLAAWDWIISMTKHQVHMPGFERASCAARPSIIRPLELLLGELTRLDYRRRLTNPNRVIRLVDSARRILSNNSADSVARERRKKRSENRIRKEQRRKQKLAEYLQRAIGDRDVK